MKILYEKEHGSERSKRQFFTLTTRNVRLSFEKIGGGEQRETKAIGCSSRLYSLFTQNCIRAAQLVVLPGLLIRVRRAELAENQFLVFFCEKTANAYRLSHTSSNFQICFLFEEQAYDADVLSFCLAKTKA